jgi:hypothetical protein
VNSNRFRGSGISGIYLLFHNLKRPGYLATGWR